ncbi:MAG: hypothetical protein MRJ65_15400 [Candidatus Brocadiaceae bacterium]|nr:hypothetical protein [Candidatus Brocadiaceae bacterium]
MGFSLQQDCSFGNAAPCIFGGNHVLIAMVASRVIKELSSRWQALKVTV